MFRKSCSATSVPALALAMTLGGCAPVGPDYVAPDTTGPAAWRTRGEGGIRSVEADPATLAGWWETLGDQTLVALVERALANNLDLGAARARVREARARRATIRADLYPGLDSSASASRSENSGPAGGVNDLYAVGFDASWEIDVFGGRRRALEVAGADLAASEADLADVLVSLLAEVAVNYVDARSFQQRVAIARANLDTQQETYDIADWRYQAGLSTALDVERAAVGLEQTRAQIPLLEVNLAQAGNRLAVLLGEAPGAVDAALATEAPVPLAPLSVAVGIPADTLRRRPDVRRAERQLAAQTARVGVATADLYPRFSISGSLGLEALDVADLFSSNADRNSIRGLVSWPVFDAARIRAGIEVQSALQEQALARYQATVLGALEEVENALIAYAREQDRRRALEQAAAAAERSVALSLDQYASGLIDFQVVVDAQRALLNLQDQLAASAAAVTSDLVVLYKALGGGWTPGAARSTQAGRADGLP